MIWRSIRAITIRKMRQSDASAISKMMKGLATFHGDKSLVTAEHFSKYCLGKKKLADAWVAEVNGVAVGFTVTYDWMNFHRAFKVRKIDLLYVDEALRKHGVGTALILKIAQDALSKNIARLDIGASKTNILANKFYCRLGFEKRIPYSHEYKMESSKLKKLSKSLRL